MFGLARKSVTEGVNPLMVSVPDIKKYLVQSFGLGGTFYELRPRRDDRDNPGSDLAATNDGGS